MSSPSQIKDLRGNPYPMIRIIAWIIGVGAAVFGLLTVYLITTSPAGSFLGKAVNFLFATNTVQAMWYVTRAAGLTAYLLLWFSTVWGLAVASKILDRILHRQFTYDFHQFISLLAIGFLVLHIVVLYLDQYLPYSIAQILVPFLSPYRPLWVGIGVIAFYLTLLVTVTFYLRGRIGMKSFRALHLFSLLGYLGGLVHAIFSGTDTPLAATQIMYYGTFLVFAYLTTYWFIMRSKFASRPAATSTIKQP